MRRSLQIGSGKPARWRVNVCRQQPNVLGIGVLPWKRAGRGLYVDKSEVNRRLSMPRRVWFGSDCPLQLSHPTREPRRFTRSATPQRRSYSRPLRVSRSRGWMVSGCFSEIGSVGGFEFSVSSRALGPIVPG